MFPTCFPVRIAFDNSMHTGANNSRPLYSSLSINNIKETHFNEQEGGILYEFTPPHSFLLLKTKWSKPLNIHQIHHFTEKTKCSWKIYNHAWNFQVSSKEKYLMVILELFPFMVRLENTFIFSWNKNILREVVVSLKF